MKNGTTETKISFSILSLRYLLLTLSILTIVRCGKSDEGSELPGHCEMYYIVCWL